MNNNYESYNDAPKETTQLNKTAVFDALAAAGITNITVAFDGWGDSGQIQGITALAGESKADLPKTLVTIHEFSYSDHDQPIKAVEQLLSEALETLCYAYLDESHGGWEIDDGSYGDFAFDVAARTIKLEYNGRITDVLTEYEEF